MITYPTEYLGCPIGGRSTVTSGPATTSSARLKGRTVSKYKDPLTKDVTNLYFSFDASQMAGWGSFWKSINNGLTPFVVPILSGGQPPVVSEVQATGGWSSTMSVDGRYDVTLPVQVLS